MRVTVFGDPAREVCLISGCGSRVSSADAWPEVAAQLTDLFGERLTLRYYDLGDAQLRARFAHVLEGARARGLGFPLVAIDGAIIAGTDDALPYPLALDSMLRFISDAGEP